MPIGTVEESRWEQYLAEDMNWREGDRWYLAITLDKAPPDWLKKPWVKVFISPIEEPDDSQ